MKKVLIALDYDPTAQKVAETGYSLAKAMNAEVILLHVISEATYYYSREYSTIMGFTGYMDMGPSELVGVTEVKTASQNFLNKSKQHLGDENIQTQVLEGDLPETIIKSADELHADIIVMGSHSRRWLEEVLLGSATEKVLHNTTKPLFIVTTKKPN